jgi:hypothetical protein
MMMYAFVTLAPTSEEVPSFTVLLGLLPHFSTILEDFLNTSRLGVQVRLHVVAIEFIYMMVYAFVTLAPTSEEVPSFTVLLSLLPHFSTILEDFLNTSRLGVQVRLHVVAIEFIYLHDDVCICDIGSNLSLST